MEFLKKIIRGYKNREREFSKIIPLVKLFDILVENIPNNDTDTLKKICEDLGMLEIESQDVLGDENLPNFNEKIVYTLKTDDNEKGIFEIIGKDGLIIQSGVQISYKKFLIISNFNEHYHIIENLFSEHFRDFGESSEPMDGMKLLIYENDKRVGYLQKVDVDKKQVITFRIGNGSVWKNKKF